MAMREQRRRCRQNQELVCGEGPQKWRVTHRHDTASSISTVWVAARSNKLVGKLAELSWSGWWVKRLHLPCLGLPKSLQLIYWDSVCTPCRHYPPGGGSAEVHAWTWFRTSGQQVTTAVWEFGVHSGFLKTNLSSLLTFLRVHSDWPVGEAKALWGSKVERWAGPVLVDRQSSAKGCQVPPVFLTLFSSVLSLGLPWQPRQGSVFPQRLRDQKCLWFLSFQPLPHA